MRYWSKHADFVVVSGRTVLGAKIGRLEVTYTALMHVSKGLALMTK